MPSTGERMLELLTLLQRRHRWGGQELADRLGLDSVPRLDAAEGVTLAGREVSKGAPLFPRVTPAWAEGADD